MIKCRKWYLKHRNLHEIRQEASVFTQQCGSWEIHSQGKKERSELIVQSNNPQTAQRYHYTINSPPPKTQQFSPESHKNMLQMQHHSTRKGSGQKWYCDGIIVQSNAVEINQMHAQARVHPKV